MGRLKNIIEYRSITKKLGRRSDVSGYDQFFFIVSAGRSGSTLLRKHLLGNEKVGIPPESEDLIPMMTKIWLSDGTYEEKIEKIVIELSGKTYMSFWSIDWSDLRTRLLSKSLTERKLSDIVLEIYRLGTSNKKYLGDKTPYLVYYLNWLMKIFPKAKFIYLIRDGRAVVNSYYRSRGYTIDQACKRWNASISSFVKSSIYKENKCLVVKYEDFVSNPDKVIHEVCDYLEIPFEEAMLNPSKVDLGDTHLSHHKNVSNDINVSSIEKWRSELSKQQIDQIEKRIGQNLRKFSYL